MKPSYFRFIILTVLLVIPLFIPSQTIAKQESRTFLVTKESFSYRDGVVYKAKSTSEVQVSLLQKNETYVTYQVQDPSRYSLGNPVNITTQVTLHNYQFIGHYNERGRLEWLEYILTYYRNPVDASYPLTSNEFSVLSKTTWELFRPNVTTTLVTFSLKYTEYRDDQAITVLAEFNTINDENGLITSSEVYLNKKDESGKIIEEYFYRIEEPTLLHRAKMTPIFAYYGDIVFGSFIVFILFLAAWYLKRETLSFNIKSLFSREKTQ